MTVVKLVTVSNNAKTWGARDVLQAALEDIDSGKIGEGDKLLVLSVDQKNGSFNTHFLQCGMSASEVITLLEIAKMDIYRNEMITP